MMVQYYSLFTIHYSPFTIHFNIYPWHSWIARQTPTLKAVGSNPIG